MRNLNFALTWFGTTLCTFLLSILLLIYLSTPHIVTTKLQPQYQLYKALPNSYARSNSQQISIDKADGRSKIVADFFKLRRSPLANLAINFVNTADKYELDFRLLPAIAMHESNGGKIIPKNSFNPFGYGVYGGRVLKFSSFEEAIDKVGIGIKRDYIDKGIATPAQIMAKYTPPSLQKGGAWAIGVSAFMEALN